MCYVSVTQEIINLENNGKKKMELFRDQMNEFRWLEVDDDIQKKGYIKDENHYDKSDNILQSSYE